MKKYSIVGIMALLFIVIAGCPVKIDPATYRAEMEQWHTERLQRLKQKNGY
jgi:hypothetical protein